MHGKHIAVDCIKLYPYLCIYLTLTVNVTVNIIAKGISKMSFAFILKKYRRYPPPPQKIEQTTNFLSVFR